MTKREKAEEKPSNHGITAGESGGVVVAANFDEIETASEDEQISVEQILSALGPGEEYDSAEWRPAIVGSDYFWPAARGMVIRGVVLGVEERMTSLMVDGKTVASRFYTFELTAPCIAIRSADVLPGKDLPPPVQCTPGMHVSVLERTILRRLENSIGREVIVVCDGPGRTKRGLNLWRYRSWEKREVQVVSERVLGASEPRALPGQTG